MGGLTRQEDDWLQRATTAAIAAARSIVLGDDAAINVNAPVGRLSDIEWGWIVTAAIFAWIQTRAEQAVAEGLDTERAVRVTGFARGEPWDAGAIAAILPELGDDQSIAWSQPLAAWSRDTMIIFLQKTLALVRKAEIARDLSDSTITRKAGADRLNDTVPF